MQDNDKPVLVYATYPGMTIAEEAGRYLIEEGLAGCVNILPGMVAIYDWKGALQRDEECVLIAKTRASAASRLIEAARARHPYETPAFLVIPVFGGSEPYIAWLMSGVREG